MPTIRIEGRRPGGSWGTMDRVTGEDQARTERDARTLLNRWKGAAVDRLGPFTGWDFRLADA